MPNEVTRAPIPRPPAPRTPVPSWEVNVSGLNGLLNAMLSRYTRAADLQLSEMEAAQPRNEAAFREWLAKRRLDREGTELGMEQSEDAMTMAARDRARQIKLLEAKRAEEDARRRAFINARGMQMRQQGYSAVPGATGYGPANAADAARELERAGSGGGSIADAPPDWSSIMWNQNNAWGQGY